MDHSKPNPASCFLEGVSKNAEAASKKVGVTVSDRKKDTWF